MSASLYCFFFWRLACARSVAIGALSLFGSWGCEGLCARSGAHQISSAPPPPGHVRCRQVPVVLERGARSRSTWPGLASNEEVFCDSRLQSFLSGGASQGSLVRAKARLSSTGRDACPTNKRIRRPRFRYCLCRRTAPGARLRNRFALRAKRAQG
jgi:hypothetical protein